MVHRLLYGRSSLISRPSLSQPDKGERVPGPEQSGHRSSGYWCLFSTGREPIVTASPLNKILTSRARSGIRQPKDPAAGAHQRHNKRYLAVPSVVTHTTASAARAKSGNSGAKGSACLQSTCVSQALERIRQVAAAVCRHLPEARAVCINSTPTATARAAEWSATQEIETDPSTCKTRLAQRQAKCAN